MNQFFPPNLQKFISLNLSKLDYLKSFGNPKVLEGIYQFRRNYMSKGSVIELIERKAPKMNVDSRRNIRIMEGYFKSPLYDYSSKVFPNESMGKALWKGYFPSDEKNRAGLVLHFGGTGDHTYTYRERFFVEGLLKEGISSIILETPFHGYRKSSNELRLSLRNVSDLFLIGAALLSESIFILKWALEQGHFPHGLSGISLGGPILSSTTAAPNYTQGIIATCIPWNNLEREINSKEYLNCIKQIPDCDWYDAYNIAISNKEPRNFSNAQEFMWILMEDFTNLKMYPTIKAPHLVNAINAEKDHYVLTNGISGFPDIWPGSSVNVIPNHGHISSFFSCTDIFRNTILKTMRNIES